MKNLRTILSLFLLAASLTMAHADGVVIRYVRTTGAYKNGGTTWEDAKNNVQDAINAVRDVMKQTGATEGRVYVAAGTYTPTESTEARGASQYQAFKLYAGITLYGGFSEPGPESTPEATPEARVKVADNTLGTSYMVNKTVLSGNLTSRQAKFAYNTNKHTFSTSFYGNVYHVVWFATEGFTGNKAEGLKSQACVDGCVITGGNANNTSLIEHTHRAYGGGVYMVQNSVLRNCEIYHCAASRDGGAIYMDGGGQVEQCFVHDNQATGLGVQYGQGGGIAIEGNGRVVRSAVLNNVGRLGGGISMTGATDQQANRAVLATLVAHNNALIEAGGIYMADGGLVNNVTVVRNACYGTGITQNGMVTGRSAGIYVRNQGTLYNTIMWGGSCTRNNNVQYAFSRSSSGNAATLNHIGVENADRCNWSGTSRQNVHNLSADNTGSNPSVNYPAFAAPHATQGVISTSHSTQEDPRVSLDYGTGNNWAPQPTSFIATIGVLQKSLDYSRTDILGQAFAVKCALGAYKAMQQQASGVAHMEVPYKGDDFKDSDLTPDTSDNDILKVATVYVDPNATSMGDGTSWTSPYPDLLTAMAFFRDHGGINNAQVLVKEGTLTTANSNSTEDDIRKTTIHMYRGTRVYGGFPASLKGTDKEGRNPVKYITLLSGNVDGTGYANNAHHLVTYETSAHNTVLDGFQFRYGNATGDTIANCGAALYIHDNSDTSETNVHHVRNCVLAGNTAQHGAAVYLSAGTHFTFENCIFHNNEVTDHAAVGGDIDCGVVHVNADAVAVFDHCNFIRNVGHGLSVQGTATVNSSVFYANLKEAVDDTRGTTEGARLNGILTNGDGAVHGTGTGSGNLYDCHDTNAVNGSAILTYAKDGSATYPLFVNPTRNAGVSPAGDITTYGRATDWMPMNMNPMVNALESDTDTDITLSTPRTYGGRADIGAVENRKCETYPDGQPASGAILYVRDYRNSDGTIDLTAGGDGLSWATAINGNAVYKLTSTEQGKESQTTVSAKDYAGSTFVDGSFTKNTTYPEYNEDFAKLDGNHIDNYNGFRNKNNKADDGTEEVFFDHNYQYTSGLQYAVNKARLLNIDLKAQNAGVVPDSIEVWVASGSYFDGKGYKMQDGVNVFSGFNEAAIKAGASPAKIERQPRDYKTTIQVREVSANPSDPNYYRNAWTDVTGTINRGGNKTGQHYDWFRVLTQPRSVEGGYSGMKTSGYNNNVHFDGTTYNPLISYSSQIAKVKENATFKHVTKWDGFIIQGGFFLSSDGDEAGGGAQIRCNGQLENCEIRYNLSKSERGGGVGVRVGDIIGCSIHDNYNEAKYGGGICASRHATIYNSVIYDNDSYGAGSQAYIDNAYFYNNTIASTGTKTLAQNSFFAFGDNDYLLGSTFINNIVWPYSSTADNHVDATKSIDVNRANLTVKNNCLPPPPGVPVGAAGSNNDNHGGVTAYPDFVDPTNGNFALKNTSNCINAGLEVPYYYQTAVQGDTGFAGNTDSRPVFVTKTNALTTTFSADLPTTDIVLPGTDIVYADRIQDCAVDIGAYEFNGSYSITPQVVGDVASFFVTQNGRGKSSAADPANAACMQKLQKVLDAAGRYKYNNPTKQVIVKLAAIRDNSIKYYPCRTSAPNSANPREWSIMVPHGVELWGGYTDHYDNPAVNGFTAPRDVVNHPTYLGGKYIVERNQATAYHVVTFTDRIFDPEGNPYLKDETDLISSNAASGNNGSAIETDDTKLRLMSSNKNVTSRGVVDGCFIVGGQADGEAFANATNAATNSNRYGAGALINEYGHVRNCIIEDNTGVSGAAVAIMPGGLVSGSLLRRNTATEQGGGVYVFPHGTELALAGGVHATVSNESLSKGAVYTSTIVDNKAGNAGGGISFNNDASNAHPANALFNSVVVWNNQAPEGANVYGYTTPHYDAATETTIDVFPFAYSAVQDMRASGLNNMSVSSDNTKGVRFADPSTAEPKPANPLYGLTFISVLQETGMPISDYQRLQTELGLAAADFTGTPRHSDGRPEMSNVEIGARAFALRRPTLTAGNLLTRLYVSQPEDVDVPAAETLYASAHAIYGQQGSSFGYPFQNLQHALDYIYKARKSGLTLAGSKSVADTDFEIYVSRGTYWPTRDLCATGLGNALGNTFLLPEGVALSGGYYTQEHSGTRHFYGQLGSSQPSETTIQAMVGDVTRTVTIDHLDTQAQRNTRKHEDVNANLISEPWEYEYQTILSGDAMNTDDHHVYHVLTVIPDASYVGALPAVTANDSYTAGTTCKQTTQHPIYMDGLQILDGQAQTANKALFAAPGHASTQAYNYYHGGALMVDGNWLCTTVNGSVDYKHTGVGTSVGYRNIPVTIHNCIINSNRANYGGAISSNGDLLITQCSFAHNMAEAATELVADGHNANYPGNGGALYVTKDVTAVNTVFANNEARKTDIDTAPSNGYVSYRVAEGGATTTTQSIFGGAGGAVMAGFNSYYNFVNCDFVRNKANMYPAIYTLNPRAVDSEHGNMSLNTAFWGNEANAATQKAGDATLQFASQLVTNVFKGTGADPHNYMPANQTDLDGCYGNAWFCGYEAGTNKTAVNTTDCRSTLTGVGQWIEVTTHQNCNVTVSSSNTGTEGPNFTNPSLSAGYDGYMEAADWSFARINVLTDQGSGYLKQTWNQEGTEVSFVNEIKKPEGNEYEYYGIYDAYQDKYSHLLPIRETEYMRSLGGEDHLSSYRIAKDYSPSAQLAYIDIGVYEYPHIKLALDEGDEIDVLWVTTKEKTDNGPADGHTWQTPTSNLQLAMETLLASRNGHKKEIRLMEGEYAPMEQNYFSVDLSGIHPVLPTRWKQTLDQTEFYPQSLTIKGGYSQDLEGIYDPEAYPATLVQNHGDNLFVVKDARLRFGDLELNAASTRVMPLQIDGVTFMNTTTNSTAGSALLYKSQDVASPEEVPTSYWKNDGLATGSVIPAKLTLSKCIFRQSTGQSIVKVEQGGGDLLIYNTLFADNTGVPLDADCTTKFINNTVAHNSAALKINRLGTSELPFNQNPNEEGDGEQLTQRHDGPFKVRRKALTGAALDLGTVLYNNVFWRNNSDGVQFTLTDESKNSDNVYSVPTSNAVPSEIASRVSHNTITGLPYAPYDSQRNRGLSNTNDDLANGPNFKDPDNTNLSLRDYHLNVSMTLINKGDDPLYDSNTYDISYYDHDYTVIGEEKYTDLDLAGRKRKVGHIDLGAYEFRDALERVLYVNPDPAITGGDGSTWQYAIQDVQQAINLAALYSDINGAEAFVFVRGNSSQNMGRLTLRPGVNVYGSVTLLDEAPRLAIDDRTNDLADRDRDLDLIRQYEAKVRTSRTGMATKTATTNSLIAGLTTEGEFVNSKHDQQYYLTTILDGFHITCPENALPNTEPIVNLTPASVGTNDKHAVALRNAVIYGNHQAVAEKPLVKATDALLYNVLLVDNETPAATTAHNGLIDLGTNAYALGVTAVQNGMAKDDALTGDGTPSAVAARYVGCIYHTDEQAQTPVASPFVQHQVKAKSDPETTLFADTYHAKYQLADGQGSYIDALTAEQLKTAIPTKYYGTTAANYGPDYHHPINPAVDLDLMSNPRIVGIAMDFGALETWTLTDTRVANTTQGATLTNSSWNGGGSALTYNGKSYDVMSFTVPNYPQEGSVIYLNKGASTSGTLSLDYALLPADYTLTPSYLLLQQGASLYGNGVGVQAVQVAVDKTLSTDGTIVALPYAINSITAHGSGSGTPACYEYSGEERSDWQYKFHASESDAWNEVTKAPFSSANNGILVMGIDGTARIMGYGNNETAYVYTELRGGKSKSVTLTPNDDTESTNNAADFTDKDNMGWNLIGLPYLVSEYKPYATKTTSGYMQTMTGLSTEVSALHIPHTLWIYYNEVAGGTSTGGNTAGYYSVPSWDNTPSEWHISGIPAIWWGEGLFLQTAAKAETLTFYRPDYVAPVSPKSGTRRMTRYYAGELPEEDELTPLAPAFHTRKVTVRTGQLRVEVPTDATAVEVIDAQGRVRATTDTTTSLHLPNGVYILRVRH